jgi:hypothetical protein
MHRLLGVSIRRDTKVVEEAIEFGKGEAAQSKRLRAQAM